MANEDVLVMSFVKRGARGWVLGVYAPESLARAQEDAKAHHADQATYESLKSKRYSDLPWTEESPGGKRVWQADRGPRIDEKYVIKEWPVIRLSPQSNDQKVTA